MNAPRLVLLALVVTAAGAVLAGDPNRAIDTALGPLTGTVTPGGSTALTGSGIYNNAALSTTATKVINGTGRDTRVRRCKLTCVTSGRLCSWAMVANGAASPANKADGDGGSDEGSLITGAPASEWMPVPGNMDVYMAASASSTVVQVTCVEQ